MIQLFSNGGKNITVNEYFYYQYYTYRPLRHQLSSSRYSASSQRFNLKFMQVFELRTGLSDSKMLVTLGPAL